ncbi:unnamed protein product [Lactuca saligna]|uniref:Uncharacterized protein n=1 Tax=Lactuca saligna TaxID=75948 RepID=A0AA35ZB10_LACSI|nr:unnamed protein product [Lactuca saligna]
MKSCITDVTALLSDLIEARDLTIPINVQKYMGEKLRSTFAILHRLEGVSESSGTPKQGGDQPNPVKHVYVVKSETEPKELKRRKAREEEIDEHQRIIQEAEAKEKDKKEAQLTVKSRKLLSKVDFEASSKFSI